MIAHEHRGNATGRVRSLNVGTERENPAPRRVSTGIFKQPIDGPVAIADPGPRDPDAPVASGVSGDFVGDRAHHGGRFQAVYAFDRAELDALLDLALAGTAELARIQAETLAGDAEGRA